MSGKVSGKHDEINILMIIATISHHFLCQSDGGVALSITKDARRISHSHPMAMRVRVTAGLVKWIKVKVRDMQEFSNETKDHIQYQKSGEEPH